MRGITNIDVNFGIPFLNTKEDYEYIRTHFPEHRWKPKFQELLNKRKIWVNTGKLEKGVEGVTGENFKVLSNDETKERHQYQLKEDPNCKLSRLAFTVKEIEKEIGNV